MARKDYSVKKSTKYKSSGVSAPAQLARMNALDRSFVTGVPLKDKNSKKNKRRVNLS
jgi:hypothetical protein